MRIVFVIILIFSHLSCSSVQGLYRIANADFDRVLCTVVAGRTERIAVRPGEFDGDHFLVIYLDMPELNQEEFKLFKGAVCHCNNYTGAKGGIKADAYR